MLAWSKAVPVAPFGRQSAAAITALPIRNRRGTMVGIVNPQRPQILSLRAAFWTIGPFSLQTSWSTRGAPPARTFERAWRSAAVWCRGSPETSGDLHRDESARPLNPKRSEDSQFLDLFAGDSWRLCG